MKIKLKGNKGGANSLVIILIIVIFILAGFLVYFIKNPIVKYESSEKIAATNLDIKSISDINNTSDAINILSYKGKWEYVENGIVEREITISEIDNNKLKFDLGIYRTASFDAITATLNGNIATFEINENDVNIKGNIILKDDTVILTITESTWDLVGKGKNTFVRASVEKDVLNTNDDSTSADAINVSIYKGKWEYIENGITEREITINEIDGNKIKFDLGIYRTAVFDEIIATLNGNIGTFEIDKDDINIKGNLILKDNSIVLNITESTWDLVGKGTNTFIKTSVEKDVLNTSK